VGALVLHGFTGNPTSMRGLAHAFAGAGFTVELPRLPGHGTTVEDMMTTSWDDWSAHVEAVYDDLAARTRVVIVAGLSMGGTLTAWLASRHPEIAGIVLVNAAVEPMAESFLDILRGALAGGVDRIPSIGSDIADPDATESAYEGAPIEPMLSLAVAVTALADKLPDIQCPALVFTSKQDHVVPPTAGPYFVQATSGPAEFVELERSFHVATLDYDRGLIEERSVAFARRVAGL
jgi:carboxylesterase